jgi:hypothetical protein
MLSMGLHRLSFMVSVMLLGGVVGFWPWNCRPRGKPCRGWSVLLPCCGCSGGKLAPMLRHLGEGWSKIPSPLDVVRNSSVESSIVASCGVDAPQRVEPTKMAPSLPLLGDRLRLPK